MFSFSTEQKVYEIQGIKIGGQPGENPTVLFGTIFYGGEFSDFGSDEKKRAEKLIDTHMEMGALTGNPAVVDIFIESKEDIRKNIEFVLDHLPENSPFSVDIPEAEVRVEALRYLKEAGLLDRVIYNSLNLGLTPEEFELLKENTPAAAIILGYNPKDFSVDGRMDIIESGAGMLEKGLMNYADDAGIEVRLLDSAAVPFDNKAAETIRAIPVMKNKWGMPVGCSFHNTVESWQWLNHYRKKNPETYRICDIASNGFIVLFGASFSLYGPIESAKLVFPYVAMVDKIVSEGAEDYFGVLPSEGHPRLKLE